MNESVSGKVVGAMCFWDCKDGIVPLAPLNGRLREAGFPELKPKAARDESGTPVVTGKMVSRHTQWIATKSVDAIKVGSGVDAYFVTPDGIERMRRLKEVVEGCGSRCSMTVGPLTDERSGASAGMRSAALSLLVERLNRLEKAFRASQSLQKLQGMEWEAADIARLAVMFGAATGSDELSDGVAGKAGDLAKRIGKLREDANDLANRKLDPL